MKINITLTLDKNNEAETAYSSILDMTFASYSIIKNIQPELPELSCECCDCGDTLEYRIFCDKDITAEDLQEILKSTLTNDIKDF